MTVMSKSELTDRVEDFERHLDVWAEGLRHSKRLALDAEPGKIYKVTKCIQHIAVDKLSGGMLTKKFFYGILTELHATEFEGPYGEKAYSVSFGFKVLGNHEVITNKQEGMARLKGCFIESVVPVSFLDLYGSLTAPDYCTRAFGAIKECYLETNREKQIKQILKWYCEADPNSWGTLFVGAEFYKYLDVSLAPLLMAGAPDLAKLILNKGV